MGNIEESGSGRRSRRTRLPRVRAARIAVALIIVIAACERAPSTARAGDRSAPVVAFDSGRVSIETATDTVGLDVELAESAEQQTHGLMERTRLDEDAGMLFVFSAPRDASSGFWMFRTRIPLDIAYIDENDRIVSIRTMQPCESPNPQLCRTYPADAAYVNALEVNAGYFERHGISVGDRVVRLGTN